MSIIQSILIMRLEGKTFRIRKFSRCGTKVDVEKTIVTDFNDEKTFYHEIDAERIIRITDLTFFILAFSSVIGLIVSMQIQFEAYYPGEDDFDFPVPEPEF